MGSNFSNDATPGLNNWYYGLSFNVYKINSSGEYYLYGNAGGAYFNDITPYLIDSDENLHLYTYKFSFHDFFNNYYISDNHNSPDMFYQFEFQWTYQKDLFLLGTTYSKYFATDNTNYILQYKWDNNDTIDSWASFFRGDGFTQPYVNTNGSRVPIINASGEVVGYSNSNGTNIPVINASGEYVGTFESSNNLAIDTSSINNLLGSIKSFTSGFFNIFTTFPFWFHSLIMLGLVVCITCRILGR